MLNWIKNTVLGKLIDKLIEGNDHQSSKADVIITFYGTERQETVARLKKSELRLLLMAMGQEDISEYSSLNEFLEQDMYVIEEILEDYDIDTGLDTSEMQTYSIVDRFAVTVRGQKVFSSDGHFWSTETGFLENGKAKPYYGLKPEKNTVLLVEEVTGRAYYEFSIPATEFHERLLNIDKESFYRSTYEGQTIELLASENSCDDTDGFTLYDTADFADLAKKFGGKPS